MLNVENIVDLGEGIWQICIPFSDQVVNVFLIEDKKTTLVDAGPPNKEARQLLIDSIRWIGYEWFEIDQIILTHQHIDHVGGLFFLKTDSPKIGFKGISSLICDYEKFEKSHVNVIDGLLHHYPEYKKKLTSTTAIQSITSMFPSNGVNFTNCREVADRELIYLGDRALKVIYTPGHSQVHMCLYEERKKLLFSGDFILQRGPALVELMGDSIFDFQQSAKAVETLEIDTIYPSHGSSINPSEAFGHITQYIESQENKILTELKSGEKNIEELLNSYYGFPVQLHQSPFLLGGLDTFLQHLIREQKIQKNGVDIQRLQ